MGCVLIQEDYRQVEDILIHAFFQHAVDAPSSILALPVIVIDNSIEELRNGQAGLSGQEARFLRGLQYVCMSRLLYFF